MLVFKYAGSYIKQRWKNEAGQCFLDMWISMVYLRRCETLVYLRMYFVLNKHMKRVSVVFWRCKQ